MTNAKLIVRLKKDGLTEIVQRGIIRQVFVIVDLSKAMSEADLRPNRASATLSLLERFIHDFFDQNPLSHMGIIGTRDSLAFKLAELSGNPAELLRAVQSKDNREVKGDASLQNALEMARAGLAHVPQHVSREIVFIYGSLTSCDPGNISETVDRLCKDTIRVSIVGLSAEVQICKRLCSATNGVYSVITSESHFKDALFDHIAPHALLLTQQSHSTIIQMGFPPTRIFPDIVLCSW